MARKTVTPPKNHLPASLTKPRDYVRAQILSRIEVGAEIGARPLHGEADLQIARADYRRWSDFNEELLRRSFSTDEYAKEYSRYAGIGVMVLGGGPAPFHELASDFQDDLQTKLARLSSIAERLDLIDEAPGVAESVTQVAPVPALRGPSTTNKVFLVHGQDEEAKAVVARFLERCDLEPIILHEQPNGGRTIIEKFEAEADVGFAVILLTPDDVGGLQEGGAMTSSALKARARQNVILELGYFTGRLGRPRVAALKKGELELPSDIAGLVWTAFGPDGAWKMSLARELKAAGYEFDIGRALGI